MLRASAQSVEALQAEVQRLGKQLRNERLKAAAMSEQLETPLNVHRRAKLALGYQLILVCSSDKAACATSQPHSSALNRLSWPSVVQRELGWNVHALHKRLLVSLPTSLSHHPI